MKGIFYGVGVGAGKKDELTLKALETIRKCGVIIFPNKSREDCRSYQLVKEALPEIDGKELIFCDFPMTKDKDKVEAAWADAAKKAVQALKNESVAFLTIGDVSIYSTFFYIKSLVEKEGFTCEIVSGLPSFCAVAARLGTSLAQDDQQIHVIPDAEKLQAAFELSGTLIFMKIGKKLGALKEFLIKHQDEILEFGAVSNCGFEDEKIIKSPDQLDEGRYLTVAIVKTKKSGLRESEKTDGFSHKFFQNRSCKSFPCHKDVPEEDFNCLFCYCPLYALGSSCGGNFKYTEKGIKSCIKCNFPHFRENYDKITARFPEISVIADENNFNKKNNNK